MELSHTSIPLIHPTREKEEEEEEEEEEEDMQL
jgi:hypothetical protein